MEVVKPFIRRGANTFANIVYIECVELHVLTFPPVALMSDLNVF